MPSPAKDDTAAPASEGEPAKKLQPVFYVKIVAKKDSTEHMFKSLISRKHAVKPLDYNIKQEEKVTECYLKYESHDQARDVTELIKDEKINGAPFETEIMEVDPQPTDSDSDESEPNEHDKTEGELSTNTIETITKALKKNKTKRKQVRLAVSPKSKKQKMKSGSAKRRKARKLNSDDSLDLNSDSEAFLPGTSSKDILQQVQKILSKEPIAAASMSKSRGFDPAADIPKKPSRVIKDKAKKLLEVVNLESSEEENDEAAQVSRLIAQLKKSRKKSKPKKSKKKRRYSSSTSDSEDSTDSDTSSDDSRKRRKSRKHFSSTSSSEDSPGKLRRELKRLRKKGKLKSGRHRKGLAVIRNEEWPHDGVNAKLAGKHFKTVEALTPMAFVAGILNPILESTEFKKLESQKIAPKMRQKLQILNEMIHGIIRSDNFEEVKNFYLTTLEEVETGLGSWKDKDYWGTQMVMFRTVLRAAPATVQPRRNNLDVKNNTILSKDCCYHFNNDGCTKSSPHPNNDPTRSPETVHHFCKICVRKGLKKEHSAKSCKGGGSQQ